VVSRTGILGAGLIFKEGLSVRGLNIAATLWGSAAVGVLAGAVLSFSSGSITFRNGKFREENFGN
jgi:putative Mg2+ transporter-C (MgtC) family protein